MMAKNLQETRYLDDDEEDIDDNYFLERSKLLNKNNNQKFNNNNNDKTNLLLKCNEIEENTLKSTQRALAQIKETEIIGQTSAEELIYQREQLERVNDHLDHVNNALTFSQKQIQSIKGIFGGLKNFFTNKSMKKSFDTEPLKKSKSAFSAIFDKTNDKTGLHPVFKLNDKYCDTNCRDSICDKPSSKEDLINKNVEDVLESVKKLKFLANGLGSEIDEQNELLDDIIEKAEIVDITLVKQNREIQKILK